MWLHGYEQVDEKFVSIVAQAITREHASLK